MARVFRQTFDWAFDTPPDTIWPVIADTARFNEAAGLPNHPVTETPRADGSVEYVARARKGPFALVWEERPVNWVWGKWFEHCRDFRTGPLKFLCARFELEPEGNGARGRYTIEAAPNGAIGWSILATGFFRNAERSFGQMAAAAREYAAGRRETAFDFEPPPLGEDARARLAAQIERIEESGYGHGLADRLANLVRTAQEVDLWRIRPLALARSWGVATREAVELCLEATRAGLLDLRWDLLCPRCRVAKDGSGRLDELPSGAHCNTCNIDYERDFARNVELSFRPAPALRPLASGEYCLFGPMSTPHIKVHLTVPPGAEKTVDVDLEPGPYRLRTLEPGPSVDFDFAGGAFPAVRISASAVSHEPATKSGQVRIVNDDGRARTAVIEDRRWHADAFTADRVAALQSFRDLFSDQVLRPGDEVEIRRVALLFTDLGGSTAMYEEIGDASAYRLVRDHFAYLAGIVRAREGAVVKTIGDAVMAAFHDPAAALAAALDIQRKVAAFNADSSGPPIRIKVGIHLGPCIAVTLNGRLDYFGTTVNMAARLQGESRGGDVVLSKEMVADAEVAKSIDGLTAREEQAALKGFDAPVPFVRLEVA